MMKIVNAVIAYGAIAMNISACYYYFNTTCCVDNTLYFYDKQRALYKNKR